MAGLSSTEIAIGLAGIIALIGYCVFILAPAWASYGRLWEKLAATFLSLFILATLLGIGTVIGLGIVFFYDEFA